MRAAEVAGLAVAVLLAGLAAPLAAADAPLLWVAPPQVRPGGVVLLRLAAPAMFVGVTAAGRALPLPEPEAKTMLLGVDLDTPAGRLPVVVDLHEGGRLSRLEPVVQVLESPYPVQTLTLPRRFTDLDRATLARVAAEKAILERLWETTSARLWRDAFRFPLEGHPRGSGFGLRRVINGEPRAPHSGVDVPAPAGTPVVAANAGWAALVADHFFSGTSVVLDHGGGLFTMYFHLQAPLVQSGQRVERAQAIGRVGSTGRSSGPHLHWGVRLQGARVDPMELIRLTAAD